MKILADVDGVLLNWEDPFHSWMAENGYELGHKDSYEIWECYSGLDPDEMHLMIEEFNASATMGFLPPIDDSVYWVDKMFNKYGVHFHCITSMGTDPYAQKLRKMNLDTYFCNISQLTILPCGSDKTHVLEQYKDSGLVWLEDNIKNAVVGSKLGLNVYLFNRSYNTNTEFDQHFTRVNNWEELYKHLFDNK